MKKKLVLFVLALGLMSFTNGYAASLIDVNPKDSNLVIVVNEDNSYNSVYSESIDTLDAKKWNCTATVTYNGVPVRTFTVTAMDESFLPMACQLAQAMAQEFIDSQEP